MSKFKVFVANEIGLCFGAENALKLTQNALKNSAVVYVFGRLLHNPTINANLEQQGVRFVYSADEVPERTTVVLRAHGIPDVERKALEAKGCTIIDALCPVLRGIRRQIDSALAEGKTVLLFGDSEHPETKFLKSGRRGVIVAQRITRQVKAQLEQIGAPVVIMSQSSKPPAEFNHFAAVFRDALADTLPVEVVNTVCKPVQERHLALSRLAGWVELMLVVGGQNSSNTNGIARVAASIVETKLIETANEIDPNWFADTEYVGLISGTSTPDESVVEVIKKLQELGGKIERIPERLKNKINGGANGQTATNGN